MFSPKVNWSKFAYYSPGDLSQFKGVIRTVLLVAVTTMINQKGMDYFEVDTSSSQLILRVGRTFDLNQGIRRIFQYRPKTQKGTYAKQLRSVTMNGFLSLFTNIYICKDNIIIDTPNEALTLMFGRDLNSDDVNTAEQIITLIKENFNKNDQHEIFKRAYNRIKGLISVVKLPTELQNL
jgi:hypothetical protein